MKKYIYLLITAVIFSSCSTNIVRMSVLEPAPVTLPPDIKKVGIVDRSGASESTEKADKIDQILSIEGGKLDKEGAAAIIDATKTELEKNDRFEKVSILDKKLKATGMGVFPQQLSWNEVQSICNKNNLDALYVLELYDTDSKIDYSTSSGTIKGPAGIEIPAVEHHATNETIIKTGWRIYNPKLKVIHDEYLRNGRVVLSGSGINPTKAAAAIIGRKDAVLQESTSLGASYAVRIVPYYVRVSRDYFVRGTNNFKIARRRAQTGNWDGAAELWQKETNNSKAKVAGRAHYNMAIINEINGDLDNAIDWAQTAYEDYNNRRALDYVRILRNRKARNQAARRQQEQK